MINSNYYKYYNPYYNYYHRNKSYFASSFNYNYNYNNSYQNEKNVEKDLEKDNFKKLNKTDPDQDSEKEENNIKTSRIFPFEIKNNRISAFGHSYAIDDLIIIALIVFLFFESNSDYTLLIVLGLMLFDISFSSIRLFN